MGTLHAVFVFPGDQIPLLEALQAVRFQPASLRSTLIHPPGKLGAYGRRLLEARAAPPDRQVQPFWSLRTQDGPAVGGNVHDPGPSQTIRGFPQGGYPATYPTRCGFHEGVVGPGSVLVRALEPL